MTWLSGLLAFLSLLTVFKAPAKPFWYVAIAVTEWGHWLALGCMTAAWISWVMSRRWSISCTLFIGAAALFLTPVLRANLIQPLDWMALFKGVSIAPVRESQVVYARKGVESLGMDVYRPLEQNRPVPGVLIVHGGSWQSGSRKEFEAFDRYLASKGYLVASIDYRLAPQSIFPAQRDDVFSAIAYLKDHAVELGFDKDRLVLLGRSAGGQIALSAAYAGIDPAIKGVVAFYAPSDLVWAYAHPSNPLIMNSRKVLETYLGGPPNRAAQAYEDASPARRVNAGVPPTLMIHGVRDELVSPLHEERLINALAGKKRPYFYLRLPWATHGCDANFSGPSGQLSTYAVERFLAAIIPLTKK